MIEEQWHFRRLKRRLLGLFGSKLLQAPLIMAKLAL